MTGMLGVYLTAAELTRRDLIVSITSRNARGADLLAADQSYKRTWSIQVKTNRKPTGFWLINKSYKDEWADQHIYVFVNLRGDEKPEYYVVPSRHVAEFGRTTLKRSTGSIWYSFYRADTLPQHRDPEGWSIFETPESCITPTIHPLHSTLKR
jgi:hypothetical protein